VFRLQGISLQIITAAQNQWFFFQFCDAAEDFEFMFEICRLQTQKTLSFAILTKKSTNSENLSLFKTLPS
jgi:hypothetical protein